MAVYGYIRCMSCQIDFDLELDHIVPRSHGGADQLFNLQWLCGRQANNCHGRKTEEDKKKYGKA